MANTRRGRGLHAVDGIPLILMIISILLISISTNTLADVPASLASTLAEGAQRVFASVGDFVERTVFSVRELRDLREQYTSLTKKLESYEILERNFADLLAENERLTEQLGFARSLAGMRVSTRIIAKDPQNIYTNYTIDKGSSAGIMKNMPVVAFQKGMEGLAGRILEVRNGTSVVLPLYDQRFFVSARFSRTRAEGLVNGQGNPDEVLVMRYISKLNAAEIRTGDLVVTSGLDSIYPPDLVIGRVRSIEMPEYGSSAIVQLESALDFSKMEYLFVIMKDQAMEGITAGPGVDPASSRKDAP